MEDFYLLPCLSHAMMTKLDNVSRREDATPLETLLNGKTYLNLEVLVCPVGGSFDVLAQTLRPETSEEELRETVLSFLTSAVLLGDLQQVTR